MKIRFALLSLLAVVVLTGCARPSARGGTGEASLEGPALVGHDSSGNASEPQDYRQVLADPGPF